ncbi:transcription factor TFIIIB component B'' homolog isoform X2 [Larimichthys crocea]|uniref:transcription factor TFIIIB component B'' homolog isoform X2 n=1 Tax=Larimichthys crocea TaxID=215358 RepID=UPI000F5E9B9F|nr:transcription factor TFIIIB component B'' homolog isoform X2 [Larimichthys crocea]
MFRRSRFSIRPNVATAGRATAAAAAAPQDAPSVSQESSETLKDTNESSTATAVTDNKSAGTPEKPAGPADGNDQNGEGTSSSAAVQRRKRFAIKPKVAPGRPSALARTPKSPAKAVSETPIEVSASDHEKPTTSGQTETTPAPQGLQSPRRRRLSEESKQLKVQPKPILTPSDSSGPSAVPPDLQTHLPEDSSKPLESTSGCEVKDVPSRLPDKIPLSLPDKEAIELSEKAKTLVSSKYGLSLSPPALSLSRLLNNPSDLQRLAKARKLRELLREEMHKEKKKKKAVSRVKEFTLDPAKMTMRDLIRYLPVSNPMTSSLEDAAPENETVVPPSPGREESPERAQEPKAPPKIGSPREEEEAVAAAAVAEGEEEEEEDEEALMVPQVKVAEDGSLIIDEESLTVEVLRAKGPNPAQDRDPIFERGSTTTYSSFRKGTYSKPWSSEETDMFFLAISMVGTDFSMICQLFPHRARSEIKNKFKKEERENAWRIDKAFRERRKLDIEYFSKLLEKILEVQKNRKKLKSLADKNSPRKHKKKSKGKKAAKNLSDVEEEDEEDENEMPDLEEGEKENEGGTPVSKPKRKRKRKTASTEEPDDKKNKTGEKSNEQDEVCIPEDAEAALPEDRANSDMPEKTQDVDAAKDTTIKPAKLSRGRAPKPLLPLGRKWGKKAPPPSTKAKDDVSDKGDESVSDGASKEQVSKDAASKRKSDNDDISSEEEDATVQPPKPTRYGRVPKPTKPLTYPAKEDAHSSASETTPASPAGSTAVAAKPKIKCTAKRGRSSKLQSTQESKKPKLVTLRASQSEDSDEENEKQWEEEEVEEEQHPACSFSKDGTAPAFVPASLRSPRPVISEVEETMEELDILANMPDVLGISQDAMCPDASCELAQNEAGTVEPCEHQLDLLVDVIDFLSSEHPEVTEDESYNEAAQTLLTIGNLAHLAQPTQNETAIQDHTTEIPSVTVDETSQHQEVEIAPKPAVQEENSAMSAISCQVVTETLENVATVEPQNSTTDTVDMPILETSDQRTAPEMDPTPQLQSTPERSKTNSPQTRRGRLSKLKPKPNLGQSSRTAKSRPEASTERTVVESHTVAPDLSQTTETLSAADETSKTADSSQQLSKEDISCVEIKLAEEPSGSQIVVAATSDQSILENQSPNQSLEQGTGNSTRESTDKMLTSPVGTTKSSCSDLVPSETGLQGTIIDSAPVQQSSDHPTSCITPVEDLPVSQKEESEDTSTRQTRRSRFPKVKPKPNLAHASRTVHSKPQTIKDAIEKDSSPTPKPKLHEKTIAEVEAEPTCSQITGPTSDLIPLLDLGSTLTPSAEEKKTDVGVLGPVESSAATSDQIASENQNFFQSSMEQASRDTRTPPESTEEKLMSHDGEAQSTDSNLLTSDSPESQVGQLGPNIDSATVQASSDHPSPCFTHVKELPVSQKEEHEVASTSQTRRGQLQKVKPKPNLLQTRSVRSRPQTTKNTETQMQLMEKPSSPPLRSETTDGTIAEAQTTCSTTSSEKPSQIQTTAPSSVSVPSLKSCPTHEPTEELSSTEGCRTEGSALDSSSEAPEQNVPQRRRRFPKVKPKPNLGSSTRISQTKLQTTDVSKPLEQCHMDTSSNVTAVQQAMDNNDAQTELKLAAKDSEHLTSTSSSLHTELLSSTKLGPAESEKSQDDTKDSEHLTSTSSLLHTELLSSTKLRPAESEKSPDDTKDSEHLTSTSSLLHTELLSSTNLGPAESEKSQDDTKDVGTSSDGFVIATSSVSESQSVVTDSVPENKSLEKPTAEGESTGDKVEAGPASQDTSITPTESNTQLTAAISDVLPSEDGSKESNIKSANTPCTADPKEKTQQPRSENDSEAQSPAVVQQCSQTTETNLTAAQSTDEHKLESKDSSESSRKAPPIRRGRLVKPKPNLGRSSQPPQPKQVQNIKQAEEVSGNHSEDVDASISHKPVSEIRPDIQEPAEGAVEQHIIPPVNDAASSLACITPVIEQLSQQDSPSDVAGSSLGCLTQVPDNSTQSPDASTSGTEVTQIHPSLTIFPDMLSDQVPSDPDEPFFILSLTEIPVCPSGEVVDSVSEPLSYLPATDASVQQQSDLGAADGLLSDVAVPASTEESSETGLVGSDTAAQMHSIVENPVDPHESSSVQPSMLAEAAENDDEAEPPPSKQRPGRAAKLQVKPKTQRKRQASKEAESTPAQDSELPGPSEEPKVMDELSDEPQKESGDRTDLEKEIPTGGKDPEDSSSGAQTTGRRGTSSRKRKPKSLHPVSETSITSDSAPNKPASKAKTSRAAGKRSARAQVRSPSDNRSPTPGPTQPPPEEETHSAPSNTSPTQTEAAVVQTSEHGRLCSDPAPSTSPWTAEVSASQQSDSLESSSMEEEEPMSVSQYFLSDIFTEVEEG